jgi:hypothetical protein
MNTTYASKINPRFDNAGVQDVSADLSVAKAGLDVLVKQNENELKALRNIAQDQAQIDFNRGAVDLAKKYDTDYEGLDRALLELENKLYNQVRPTHPDMAEDLLRQYDNARFRAVEHARKENISKNNKRIKDGSYLMLDGLEAQAKTDAFLYISEVSSKNPDERKKENIMPFLNDIRQYNGILYRTDMEGNPIFTPSQIESKKGLRGSMKDAMYEFIDGSTADQLENFYNTRFQSKQWLDDTGFSQDDKHKFETRIKSRIKELKDDTKHQIQVRAIQDTASLLAEYSDEKIDELRKNTEAPKPLVKKAQELNEKIIKANWYDPKNASDPTGVFEALISMDSIIKNPNTDTDSMAEKVAMGQDIVDTMIQNAKKMNLSNDEIKEVGGWISDSITDDAFAKNIQMLDVSPWVNGIVEARRADIMNNPADYGKNALERFNEQQAAYAAAGELSPLQKEAQESALKTVRHGHMNRVTAHNLAYDNAKRDLIEIMDYLRGTGNVNAAKNMLEKAKYNYVKTYNSDWIPNSDFDKLQEEYSQGKKPTYFHNGILWEYQGYQGDGAVFKTKL